MSGNAINRRHFILAGAAGMLAGCDRMAQSASGRRLVETAESVTYRAQRMLLGANRLVPEFSEADITPNFKSNGTGDPPDRNYKRLASNNFADWRLRVDGLVDRALNLSLADLREFPARTQITRHDCVEGWSCIGKWKGPPLSEILARAGMKANAKFVVFRCADTMEGGDEETAADPAPGGTQLPIKSPTTLDSRAIRYYESIDLVDALHPQTILAYEMNGKPLPIPYGAPLRLRVERQLGYKMAKYLMRIELVNSYASIGEGKGGYWEDRGYEWYAGI